MSMPRNPGEAEWLVRSAEEEAARAARWAAVAQHQAAYQSALAKAHAADAEGLRKLWNVSTTATIAPTLKPEVLPEDASTQDTAAASLDPPKCLCCGKETRYLNGRPQKFCSVTVENPTNCAQRFRDRRRLSIIKEARNRAKEASQKAVSKKINTIESNEKPIAVEKLAVANANSGAKEIYCVDVTVDESADTKPTCLSCGKVTRIWRGRPQKFCPPAQGRRVSQCATAYHDRERRSSSSRRAPRRKRASKRAATPLPGGSVLATASTRAPGHDLLSSITQAVPQGIPEQLRLEIISETALLSLEGLELTAAIAQATKNVNKNAGPLRYAKDIDGCYWLSADSGNEDLGIAEVGR